MYDLICSEEMFQNKEALNLIARRFSLPLNALKVSTDSHYHVHTEEELNNLFDDDGNDDYQN